MHSTHLLVIFSKEMDGNCPVFSIEGRVVAFVQTSCSLLPLVKFTASLKDANDCK